MAACRPGLAAWLALACAACLALSGCSAILRSTMVQAEAGTSGRTLAAATAAPQAALPLPTPFAAAPGPVGLQSVPTQTLQGAARQDALQAEAEYLALALAEQATGAIIQATAALGNQQMTGAQSLACDRAMQIILESAQPVLGVPAEQARLSQALVLAQQALPQVLETLQALETGTMTPEQALQQLEGAQTQLRQATQTAEQALAAGLPTDQARIERLRSRAAAQIEHALQAAAQPQGGTALEQGGTPRRQGH